MSTPEEKKKTSGSMSKSQKWVMLVGAMALAFPILPVLMILLIGLLPTLTVLITDPKNTRKLISVGCFNLAGVFIFIVNIAHHYSLTGAFNIVSNIFNLIIMLGSAAIGIILYAELPNLFIIITDLTKKRTIKLINNRLDKLEEEWGDELFRSIEAKNSTKKPAPKA